MEMQEDSFGDMLFDTPSFVVYASSFTLAATGDVTGIPGGVGAMPERLLFMERDDVSEVEIGKIGTESGWMELEP